MRANTPRWHRKRSLSVVGALAIGIVLAAGPSRAQAQQSCSPDVVERWRQAEHEQLGIVVPDKDGFVGARAARHKTTSGLLNVLNPGGKANWYPVDGRRHTLCGELNYWSVFKGPDGDEMDFHPKLTVAPRYSYLLEEAPEWTGNKAGECPARDGACMFGEVTPPAAFLDEFFRPLPDVPTFLDCNPRTSPACKPTTITKGRVCASGPWVMEDFHGWWPEIHPAEIIWGREGDAVAVYAIDDRSGRFKSPDDYLPVRRRDITDGSYVAAEHRAWKPWVQSGSTRTISLAWAADAARDVRFVLADGNDPFVTLRAAVSPDHDLVVETNLPESRVVLPAASEACLDDGRLIGFVDVKMSSPVGEGMSKLSIKGPLRLPEDEGATAPSHVARSAPAAAAPCSDARLEASLLAVEGSPLRSPEPLNDASLRSYWGLEQGRMSWSASERQRLLIQLTYLSAATPEAHCLDVLNKSLLDGTAKVEASWAVEIKRVETGGKPFVLAAASGPRQVAAEFFSSPGIRLVVPDPAVSYRLAKGAAANQLRAQVTFPNWGSLPPQTALYIPTIAVKLTAVFTDGESRRGVFSREFVSRSPRLGPGILEREVWPDALLGIALARARADDPSVTRALLEDHWRLDLIKGDRPTSRRYARELRLAGLRSVEDGDVDPEELGRLMSMTLAWARSLKEP